MTIFLKRMIKKEIKKIETLFLEKEQSLIPVEDENDWERKHLNRRSESIDVILEHYAAQQNERYIFKKHCKRFFVCFFILLAIAIIVGSFYLAVFAINNLKDNTLEFLTCLITSGVSCFSSIISILLIIVKYVFPNDEEINFNNLVSIIVENDTRRLKDLSSNHYRAKVNKNSDKDSKENK